MGNSISGMCVHDCVLESTNRTQDYEELSSYLVFFIFFGQEIWLLNSFLLLKRKTVIWCP